MQSVLPRSARVLAATAAAAVAALSCAAAAHAEGALQPDVRTITQTPAQVAAFWTPERMRGVKPMEMPAEAAGALRGSAAPADAAAPLGRTAGPALRTRAVKRPRAPRLPVRAMSSWYGLELPWSNYSYGYTTSTKAVGRLFMTTPAGNSSCSATVVATNVILTAGHCVRDGANGADNTNFKFVPGVYGTSAPYGAFYGRAVSVYDQWSISPYNCATGTGCFGYSPLDYAFITLYPNASGYNVGQYTGSFGLWTNAPKADVYHLGYPAEGTWASNANYPWHCKSPIQRYDQYYDNRYDVGMSCYDTGGASGGPWFEYSNGVAYVSSVMSHMGVVKWQDSACTTTGCARYGTTFFGPYFTDETTRLLNIAKLR